MSVEILIFTNWFCVSGPSAFRTVGISTCREFFCWRSTCRYLEWSEFQLVEFKFVNISSIRISNCWDFIYRSIRWSAFRTVEISTYQEFVWRRLTCQYLELIFRNKFQFVSFNFLIFRLSTFRSVGISDVWISTNQHLEL